MSGKVDVARLRKTYDLEKMQAMQVESPEPDACYEHDAEPEWKRKQEAEGVQLLDRGVDVHICITTVCKRVRNVR